MKQTGSSQLYLKKKAQIAKSFLESHLGPLTVKNSRFLFALLLSTMLIWFLLGTVLQDTSIQPKQNNANLVKVQVIDSKAIEKTTYYTLQGTLQALNKVTLRSATKGFVKNIVSDKGTRLLNGETILNLSFDSRLSKLREAQALVEQRQLEFENAKKLQTNKFRSRTDVAGAKSVLESAQANLEQIQEDIEDTKIRAPFDGQVDLRHVELGDYVREGDPLVDFVSLNPLIGVVNVAEKDIHLIKLGSECLIECKGSCRTGIVTFISAIADANTRTYTVEITVDNPDESIPDGITAAIRIPIETSPAHLFSPAAIAMDDDGRPGIKVVNQDNVVEFYKINVLNHDETGIWVRDLPEHVRIITIGQFFIRAGDKVDPIVIPQKQQPNISAPLPPKPDTQAEAKTETPQAAQTTAETNNLKISAQKKLEKNASNDTQSQQQPLTKNPETEGNNVAY